MTQPLIQIKGLKKNFGSLEVLKGIDLDVQEKEVVVIIGPSGSGKSTLLRCINYLEEPTAGTITFDNIPLNGDANINEVRKEVGMVFQRFNLFPHMTVLQNLTLAPMKVRGISRQEAEETAMHYLGRVGLAMKADSYPDQLSGGQQQRVALARALVAEPGLLLLDEPLSNLDAKLRESMRFEISGLQKKLGITVIYVTHDQSEAMTMSDRIVVMSMGKVQQIGKPVDVYSHPANQMVADFVGLVNFIPSEVRGDGKVYLENTDISFPNEKNLSGKVVLAVRPENISLHKDHGMIEGLLHHHFYLGDSIDYRVQVKGHFIRVIVKGAEFGKFKDGDKVFLDFDKVLTFPQQ